MRQAAMKKEMNVQGKRKWSPNAYSYNWDKLKSGEFTVAIRRK